MLCCASGNVTCRHEIHSHTHKGFNVHLGCEIPEGQCHRRINPIAARNLITTAAKQKPQNSQGQNLRRGAVQDVKTLMIDNRRGAPRGGLNKFVNAKTLAKRSELLEKSLQIHKTAQCQNLGKIWHKKGLEKIEAGKCPRGNH